MTRAGPARSHTLLDGGQRAGHHKGLLIVPLLGAGIGFTLLPGAAKADCTYNTIGTFTYVQCDGPGYSYGGTTSQIGSFSYGDYFGRVGGSSFSANSTSSRIGDYTYSDLYGRLGSQRLSGSSTDYWSGAFGSGDYNGRVGDWRYSGTSSSTRLGNTTYTDYSTRWSRWP